MGYLLALKDTYNLSILDFKAIISILNCKYLFSYNLSILDFKAIISILNCKYLFSDNLSILDFKVILYRLILIVCCLIIYPYWILNDVDNIIIIHSDLPYNLSILDFK